MPKSYIDHFAPVTPVFGPRKSLSYVDHVAPPKPTHGVSQSDTYISHFPPPIPTGAPSQAISAGFTSLNFDQEPGNWDIGFTANGHKWQAGLWWQTVPAANSFSVDAYGILTITDFNSTGQGTSLCTQYHDYSGGTYFNGGYFEAYMYCTDWSAFWLFCAAGPMHPPVTAGQPLTYNNEIDIIETDPGPSFTANATTTIHLNTNSYGGVADTINSNNNNPISNPPICEDWHIFGCLWIPSQVTWYVDNVPVASAPTYPSTNQPATLILGAGPGGVNGSPSAVTPPITRVQWVRVWEPPGYTNPPI